MANEPRALLETVLTRYSQLTSYQDVGLVYWPGRSHDPMCWFNTKFAAPNSFRFEFVRPHPSPRLRHLLTKYAAGEDASGAYFSTQKRGSTAAVEAEESVEMAVAGATGISRGAAFHIGQLLLPSIQGNGFRSYKQLRFRPGAKIDGVRCDRISGRSWRGSPVSIWVGSNDLLVRKIVSLKHEEVRFEIQTDVPVDQAAFDRAGK